MPVPIMPSAADKTQDENFATYQELADLEYEFDEVEDEISESLKISGPSTFSENKANRTTIFPFQSASSTS